MKVYDDSFELLGKSFSSRFLLGTAGYPSPEVLMNTIKMAGVEIVTMGVKRQVSGSPGIENKLLSKIRGLGLKILPNTAGCRTATEAVTVAEVSREIFETDWIKLEVIGDDYSLQPEPFELVEATGKLVKKGFKVFAFCTEDILVAERLVLEGCNILMPWGSPIGSAQGIINPEALTRFREKFPDLTVIVDVGIGAPSHASMAMELGCDAVLLNSAVSQSVNPVRMGNAFKSAILGGREAYRAGLIKPQSFASASTQVGSSIF